MRNSAKKLLDEAMSLPAPERAQLVQELVKTLDEPNSRLDALWLKEAQSRMTAYRAGELEAVDAEEVFKELGQKI